MPFATDSVGHVGTRRVELRGRRLHAEMIADARSCIIFMAFLNHWLLTTLLLLPAAGASIVWIVRPISAMRWTALSIALATLCLSLLILIPFKWLRSGAYAYRPAGTVQMLGGTERGPAQCEVAIDGLS